MQNTIAQIQAQASNIAKTKLATIATTAGVLADFMAEAYGGSWRADVDEYGEFIVIRPEPLTARARLDAAIAELKAAAEAFDPTIGNWSILEDFDRSVWRTRIAIFAHSDPKLASTRRMKP